MSLKIDVEAYMYNHSTGEVEAGGLGIQGHSQLCTEVKARLGYM